MEFRYSSQFKKRYKKLPRKVQEQFGKQLLVLSKEPRNAQLHIHKLSGEYEGLWSMNITGDVRAVYDKFYQDVIIFVAIGSHSELYS